MKIKHGIPLLLATVLFSFGASAGINKFELRADLVKVEGSKTIAKGSAVVTAGDTTISAEHIIVDNESGEIRCVGDTVIKTAQLTVTAKDPKIDTKALKSTTTTPVRPREIRDLPSPNVRF